MVRILLCGDLRGQLKQLCENVKRLHARLDAAQHFEAVFCVGEFSTENMDFDMIPPVPIYFVDAGPGARDLIAESPQGKEIKPGFHFLGHYGVIKVAGLTIAYLSGRYRQDLFEGASAINDDDSITKNNNDAHVLTWEEIRAREKIAEVGCTEIFVDACYTPLAIQRLKEEITEAGGVDLLLTSEWPSGCLRGVPMEVRSDLDRAVVKQCSSPAVAELAVLAEPKYHVVGLCGTFWRRPPWRHEHRGVIVPSTGALQCGVCRMIAMGSTGGGGASSSNNGTSCASKAQKLLHGLDLEPHTLPAVVDDATPSPWSSKVDSKLNSTSETSKNGEVEGHAHPFSFLADAESKRRWLQRFGTTPTEMQSASDKLAHVNNPEEKDKKKRRQSLYPTEKDNKRKRGGPADHEHFAMRERKAAGRANINGY